MSNGHDKASFYQGIRAAISWLHAEARGMNDPHAKLVLNNAAFHLGQRKPDPALLPPAPDGGTEGWRLVPVEPTPEMLKAVWAWPIEELRDVRGRLGMGGTDALGIYRAMLAASPSVSPVGPKEGLGSYSASEEAAPSGATAPWRDIESALKDGTWFLAAWPLHDGSGWVHGVVQWRDGEWLEADQRVGGFTHWLPLPNPSASASPLGEGKPGAVATYADNPSSQPTQTGEENAGLVEEARLRATSMRKDRFLQDEAACMDRLADALASRSPIPGEDRTRAENAQVGELKALSDAAKAGPWRHFMTEIDGQLCGAINSGGFNVPVARFVAEVDCAFIVACVNHVRQALAKVAEGGVASAADSA